MGVTTATAAIVSALVLAVVNRAVVEINVVNAKAIARVLTANVTLLVCARLVHAQKTTANVTLAARATIVNVIHLADAKFAHVKQIFANAVLTVNAPIANAFFLRV